MDSFYYFVIMDSSPSEASPPLQASLCCPVCCTQWRTPHQSLCELCLGPSCLKPWAQEFLQEGASFFSSCSPSFQIGQYSTVHQRQQYCSKTNLHPAHFDPNYIINNSKKNKIKNKWLSELLCWTESISEVHGLFEKWFSMFLMFILQVHGHRPSPPEST